MRWGPPRLKDFIDAEPPEQHAQFFVQPGNEA